MIGLPKVSIIMPVYNGENFIAQTLKYLEEQNFNEFEVIIVDDHSTDHSVQIIEKFCKKDKRFNLFFNTKKGVSSARNLGLQKVTGEYIIHYDADDIIPSDAIWNLYNRITDGVDIVIGDYIIKTGNVENVEIQNFGTTTNEVIKGLITNRIHGGLWNKLIRKELYSDLQFDESVNYMEDKLILIEILLKKPKIVLLNKVVYKYIQHPGSITGSLSDNSMRSFKTVIEKLEKVFHNGNYMFDLSFLKIYYKLLAFLHRKKINNRKDFKEVNSKILFYKGLSFHYRILLYLKVNGMDFIPDLFLKLR